MATLDSNEMSLQPIAVAEHVVHAFLRATGRATRDYLPASIGEVRVKRFAAERATTPAATPDVPETPRVVADRALARALRLDQRCASAAEQAESLPAWLLDRSGQACLLLARANVREGRAEEAEALLQRALMVDSASGEVYREIGLLLWHTGQTADAIGAFEASMATRRRLAFDGLRESREPVLVAQPNESIDIIYYAGQYYVVPRDPMRTGARAIAGELFRLRKNRLYRLGARAARVELVRRGARVAWALKRRRARADDLAPTQRPAWARLAAPVGRLGWRALLRPLLVYLLADPVEAKAPTLMGAVELAEQQSA